MKKWSQDIEIRANIEEVWKLLNGSLEEMQKIMPNVIENEHIRGEENSVGAIYRQKYQEGKRVQEYEIETVHYVNEPDNKELKVAFNLANMFDITAQYEVKKLDDSKTYFKYTTTNNPLKWYLKPFMLVASNKVVVQFVNRVKQVAENSN